MSNLRWLSVWLVWHSLWQIALAQVVTAIQAAPQEVTAPAARLLQGNNNWHMMKVIYDYSHLKLLTPQQISLIDLIVTPKINETISKIKTKGFQQIPAFDATTTNCTFNQTLIANYSQGSTVADLLIFFMDYNQTGTGPAYSIPCGLDYDSNRTTIGIIYLNAADLRLTTDRFEYYIKAILKEHIHIMAMNSILFPYMSAISQHFVTEVSAWNEKVTVTRITTPGLVALGTSYFECSTFKGVLLEDEAGSMYGRVFWEKLMLGNEIMVADYPPRSVLSAFTLTFLNDTTWYLVNMTMAETLIWGSGLGCPFLNATCNKPFVEFCKKDGLQGCTSDYMSKSICRKSKFSNGCLISNWNEGGLCPATTGLIQTAKNEYGGPNSRCFNVTSAGQVTSGCYEMKCVANYLTIVVKGNSYTCGSAGAVLNIEPGVLSVTCPNITDFCALTNFFICPNDCSAMGVCKLNKLCSCHPFYLGDSCTVQYQCNSTVSGPVLSGAQCTAVNQFNTSATLLELSSSAWLAPGAAILCLLARFWH